MHMKTVKSRIANMKKIGLGLVKIEMGEKEKALQRRERKRKFKLDLVQAIYI